MLKKRIIPILLLKDGWIVQSKGFNKHQNIGNPMTSAIRLSEWGSDELFFLDISRNENYDLKRDDQGYSNHKSFLEIIAEVSKHTFMPFTIGGKIKSISDIEKRLALGADKISINTIAFENQEIIYNSAKEFGSQCIVVSIDVKKEGNKYVIYTNNGTKRVDSNLTDKIKIFEDLGCGEILINSIDRDGRGQGYDIELISKVCDSTKLPVIACGGVSDWDDFEEALTKTKVDACSAANIFHYKDQSVFLAKKYLCESGFEIREPKLLELNYDKIKLL
ncbi:imidazole glycerol phosphate synthase cyclase subunit [Flavobacteriaceae bacterium]|nr:imidazole glycerol phosphate synthase cyclase subunit [Flavobacteriaceae bacterium]